MIGSLKKFFETHVAVAMEESVPEVRERGYRLATAALLVEIGRADFEVNESEREAMARAIRLGFDLTASEATELLSLAEAEVDRATSLYEFTRLINDKFDHDQKGHVIELLWDVAYADGEVDKYEEHLVRKIADLIYVPHMAYIRAKHRAKAKWEEK